MNIPDFIFFQSDNFWSELESVRYIFRSVDTDGICGITMEMRLTSTDFFCFCHCFVFLKLLVLAQVIILEH